MTSRQPARGQGGNADIDKEWSLCFRGLLSGVLFVLTRRQPVKTETEKGNSKWHTCQTAFLHLKASPKVILIKSATRFPIPFWMIFFPKTRRLAEVRKSGQLPFVLPDGKSQITMRYDENGAPCHIDTVVISTQHTPDVSLDTLREALIEEVARPSLPKRMVDGRTRFLINPTGRFVIGGPAADSGLTGRKIIVDTYGGYARHGGGAFSGKDPTKVDRSASYMARYVAKNLVASGLCNRCELQFAYAIGVARPVSVLVDTFGTGRLDDARLAALVNETFDLRPAAIMDTLGLRAPIYRQTAAYGHFGRPDLDLPWERTDRAEELTQYVK